MSEFVDRRRHVLDENGRPATRAFLALAYCELDRVDDARRVFAPLAARISELPVNVEWLELIV
ncbi:MAG: hypothetical protein LC792_11130 [Actinobacteria bacterium]|nr:hypothetical protein [Actinomycetota bacterium]